MRGCKRASASVKKSREPVASAAQSTAVVIDVDNPQQHDPVKISLLSDMIFHAKHPFQCAREIPGTEIEGTTSPVEYAPTPMTDSTMPAVRHEYYGRLSVTTCGIEHTISLGDVIAFESDKYGVKEKPLKGRPWTVGQVVTLFVCKQSVKDTRYYATVQWLPRWKKQLQKKLDLTPAQKKEIHLKFRPEQALVESQTLVTLNIQEHIVPLQVAMGSWKKFQDNNPFEPDLKLTSPDGKVDVYAVFFYCVYMHHQQLPASNPDALQDVRDDWAAYLEAPKSNTTDPPVALSRAWTLLRHSKLEEALNRYYCQSMVSSSSNRSENQHPFSSYYSMWKLEAMEAAAKGPISPKPKWKLKQHDIKETQPELAPRPSKSKVILKRKEDADAPKPKQDVTVPPPNKKTKRISFEPSPQINRTTRKRPEQQIRITSAAEEEGHDATCSPKRRKTNLNINTVRPLFSPLHTATYTVPSKKRKNLKIPHSFFTSASCSPAPLHHYQQSFLNKATFRKEEPWTIHIGDVIAIRLKDDFESATSCDPKNVFPFQVEWGVAQVLSILSFAGDGTNLQMEIRWFNTFDELEEKIQKSAPLSARKGIVEMDEAVAIVGLEFALGPILVTSTTITDAPANVGPCVPSTTMPVWAVSCRYLWETEIGSDYLYELGDDDWPALKTELPQPLLSDAPIRRGLFCPKAMVQKLKYKILSKAYESFLRKRLAECESKHAETTQVERQPLKPWVAKKHQRASVRINWAQNDLDPQALIVHSHQEDQLCVSERNERFYQSFHITILKQRYDSRAISKKTSDVSDSTTFSVHMGQVVCVADNSAIHPHEEVKKNGSKSRNIFYPFKGPWSVYQILSLEAQNKKGNKSFLLEGRRLYRPCELPTEWHGFLPQHSASEKERKGALPVLYESNVVQKVPVSRVLGHVDLSLGRIQVTQDKISCEQKKTLLPDAWLTVPHQCRYFYHASLSKLQPLYVADSCPKKWKQRFVERGLSFSDHMRSNKSLCQRVESLLGYSIGIASKSQESATSNRMLSDATPHGDMLGQHFQNLWCEGKAEESTLQVAFSRRHEDSADTRTFYSSVRVEPPWLKYQLEVCHPADRKYSLWRIKVGDLVAVATQGEAQNSKETMYPFVEPWSVCQVLSIYQDGTISKERSDPSLCCVEIRFLDVSYTSETTLVIPQVFETENQGKDTIKTVPMIQLLGPVSVATRNMIQRAWDEMDLFLPALPFVFGGFRSNDISGSIEFAGYTDMLISLIKRGVAVSREYIGSEKEDILSKILLVLEEMTRDEEASITDFSKGSSKESSEALALTILKGTPFHTDQAGGLEYYDSILVKPPFESYCDNFRRPVGDVTWKVSLGNSIVVRYEHFFGSSVYGPKGSKKKPKYPFEVSWGVAELVNIFKQIPSASHNSTNQESGDDMKMEVRWFYRLSELSGRVSSNSGNLDQGHQCEEIVESDHYDVISANCLLAPAYVYENPVDLTSEKTLMEMPVLEFFCRRFWSAKRKAMVPCGALSGRIARGRLKSGIVAKDVLLAAELEKLDKSNDLRLPSTPESKAAPNLKWRDSFSNAILKFSLSDASKEGYDGQFFLVGRETERKTINSFLNGAILGRGKDSASSIFIAGPPGTGKTASVLAAVKEIKRNEDKNKLADFNFIYLNGMEMRHPFEAYVLLWEKISGTSQIAPDAAAQKLENFFTHDDPTQKTQVTVVLLDEIDYLVTKNQSVLYNFFDWPMRTKQKKLVLLGISNTLNLPEHLHQRVQSRIGQRRCIFKAYDSDQIKAILKSKLAIACPGCTVFTDDALVFASKKTASQTGDLRKAFHICRGAAEYVLHERAKDCPDFGESPVVQISDVLKVSRESFHSAQSKAVEMCSPFEALLLVTLTLLCRSTGRELGGFDVEEIVSKMEGVANAYGEDLYLPPPSLEETLNLLLRLGEAHLVSLTSPKASSVSFRASLAGSGGPWPLVSLLVEDAVISYALKGTIHNQLSKKHLARF